MPSTAELYPARTSTVPGRIPDMRSAVFRFQPGNKDRQPGGFGRRGDMREPSPAPPGGSFPAQTPDFRAGLRQAVSPDMSFVKARAPDDGTRPFLPECEIAANGAGRRTVP